MDESRDRLPAVDGEPIAGWIRDHFERQAFMDRIGATIVRAEGGSAEILLPVRVGLLQQHGFVHAGVVAAIANAAGRCAALSLWAEGTEARTAEFKISLLAPASGAVLSARSRVIRSGRRLGVFAADVFAIARGGERCVAVALGTIARHPESFR
jgi:uncharacterized protein (TIGR00369 family)